MLNTLFTPSDVQPLFSQTGRVSENATPADHNMQADYDSDDETVK
jgi:hypothetical protein